MSRTFLSLEEKTTNLATFFALDNHRAMFIYDENLLLYTRITEVEPLVKGELSLSLYCDLSEKEYYVQVIEEEEIELLDFLGTIFSHNPDRTYLCRGEVIKYLDGFRFYDYYQDIQYLCLINLLV